MGALYRRVSSAISWRDGSTDPQGATDGRDVAAIIARRAERVNNRQRGAADRYVAVHSILARGR